MCGALMSFVKCPCVEGRAILVKKTPDIRIYHNVVLDEWTLYDSQQRVIPYSSFLRGGDLQTVRQPAFFTKLNPFSSRSSVPDADMLWIGPIHLHFGHFIVSVLARLWPLLSSIPPTWKLAYVGGDKYDLFKIEHIRECFKALGISPERLVRVSEQGTRIPRIAVAEPSFIENHSIHEEYFLTLKMIANMIQGHVPDYEISEQPVYFSKENLKAGVRKVINEHDLTSYLSNHGIKIVFPESMPFAEQIRLVTRHRNIIGFSGSAMHLTGFSDARRICTLSNSIKASSNQALIDMVAGNANLYLFAKDDLRSLGRTEKFHEILEIKNPLEMGQNLLNIWSGFVQGSFPKAQYFPDQPRSVSPVALNDEPFGENVAIKGVATQSSIYTDNAHHNNTPEGAISGKLTGIYQCQTTRQDKPWWQLDLQSKHLINEIRIYNRCDVVKDRLTDMILLLSIDGQQWDEVVSRKVGDAKIGGFDGEPFRYQSTEQVVARFIKIMIPREEWLALDQVEVFGESLVEKVDTEAMPEMDGQLKEKYFSMLSIPVWNLVNH
ncbi:ATP/GTP-binding protein [Granulibacter bethesdensis CGDNIH4]|nr:ATP/GTP-binding protein [Granulibacter bethesdensis CGDNIH4]